MIGCRHNQGYSDEWKNAIKNLLKLWRQLINEKPIEKIHIMELGAIDTI
jgi:hypothetical protein